MTEERLAKNAATRSSPIRWQCGALWPTPPFLDWHKRLVCSHCGGREVDMVLTGTKRRGDET